VRRIVVAGVWAAAVLLSPAVLASADEADDSGFRVKPYLQNPADDGMTVTWFSHTDEPGELIVRGPGLGRGLSYTTEPTHEPALDYTEAELAEEIDGLEPGSWLRGDANYKHSVDLDGLEPGKTYRYGVRQDGETVTERFHTAPTSDRWRSIRFVALSDSETEPLGRVLRREWAPGSVVDGGLSRPDASEGGEWDQIFGTTVLSEVRTLRYMLTEDEGYFHNLHVVESRNPDFVVMPGDLVQGGGYQPGWDEFFRHNAGERGSVLSRRPIVPAIGNWENFGALNGGYGTADDRTPVVRARDKYHAYFDPPSNGTEAHQDNYHRIDYGPITIITLDSSNGEPDDHADNYAPEEKVVGQEYNGPGTDTQLNFTREEYEAAGGADLADFNPGSTQWEWAERELADARDQGQIVFVQFHHAPFSNGEHGLPMDHVLTSGQGGTPMRQYHDMFEEYGVVAVLSGHSEMFERSFVDADGDGIGVHYYDVGVAGDGLRGERRDGTRLDDPLLKYNPFSVWTADQDEPESWHLVDGVPQLVSGGKHYGHLEVNVETVPGSKRPPADTPAAKVTFTPAHVFPVFDSDYELVRTERREYTDRLTVYLDQQGQMLR
jgi:Calcineurin-like phosphoesterase/Purple acid Phosphatase, N-terminal domain